MEPLHHHPQLVWIFFPAVSSSSISLVHYNVEEYYMSTGQSKYCLLLLFAY